MTTFTKQERKNTDREVLKEPRSHNICGYFGEDAALFLSLFAPVVVVIFPRTITGTDTRIT